MQKSTCKLVQFTSCLIFFLFHPLPLLEGIFLLSLILFLFLAAAGCVLGGVIHQLPLAGVEPRVLQGGVGRGPLGAVETEKVLEMRTGCSRAKGGLGKGGAHNGMQRRKRRLKKGRGLLLLLYYVA